MHIQNKLVTLQLQFTDRELVSAAFCLDLFSIWKRLNAGTVPANKRTLQVQYLQIRSTPRVPSKMSVGAGWPYLWVLAFCAGCWHAVQ